MILLFHLITHIAIVCTIHTLLLFVPLADMHVFELINSFLSSFRGATALLVAAVKR